MTSHSISIYIHVPWCIKKCYYCDFNSHPVNHFDDNKIPEKQYIKKLLEDFDFTLEQLMLDNRTKLTSIFFGGGTPSLLSGQSVNNILQHINKKFNFAPNLEITLEANPGTVEQDSMHAYKAAGITRISLGAQSFQDDKLEALGRIHKSNNIINTLDNIIKAKFNSFNIDLMYGLPNQCLKDALYDLNQALSFCPPHLSWYQLTIEPNTFFYNKSRYLALNLPTEDPLWQIYTSGIEQLINNNYINYEISAFAKKNFHCQHNVNYWQYGDYLGIGPGAHSKTTKIVSNNNGKEDAEIRRLIKTKFPRKYLNSKNDMLIISDKILNKKEIIFEFMLNNLRLHEGFYIQDFKSKTGYNIEEIKDLLNIAVQKNFLEINVNHIKPTLLGRTFLSDLQALFV